MGWGLILEQYTLHTSPLPIVAKKSERNQCKPGGWFLCYKNHPLGNSIFHSFIRCFFMIPIYHLVARTMKKQVFSFISKKKTPEASKRKPHRPLSFDKPIHIFRVLTPPNKSQIRKHYSNCNVLPRKINIEPENDGLGRWFSFLNGWFVGSSR